MKQNQKNMCVFYEDDSGYAIITVWGSLSRTGLWTLEDRRVRADLIGL